jgi:hypothetical protein
LYEREGVAQEGDEGRAAGTAGAVTEKPARSGTAVAARAEALVKSPAWT